MPRVARSRSRTLASIGPGNVTRSDTGAVLASYGPYVCMTETNDDSHGLPWVDSTFRHGVHSYPKAHLSGWRVFSGSINANLNQVPLWGSVGPRLWKPWTLNSHYCPSAYTLGQLAAMAAANLNPNRPQVDLPVSIAELRELPSLLRDAGRIRNGSVNSSRTPAKANIMAQFGVLPIINDLMKLLDFADAVDKQEAYLRRLNSEKPIRIKRKITEQTWQHSDLGYIPWGSVAEPSVAYNKCTINSDVKQTSWYSCRARLTTLIPEREINSIAFRTALGIHTISSKQLWELLPWSWLIDWFSTTGDLLAAYRGGLPFVREGLCIMRQTHYEFKLSFPNLRPTTYVDLQEPQAWARYDMRDPAPGLFYPEFFIPYLSGKQLSILLSLLLIKL